MLGNAGDTGEARGEGERTTGDGRDAEGTYGGGALETDKATNTRTRALRSARKQPKSDTTPRGFDTTRHTDPCHGTWQALGTVRASQGGVRGFGELSSFLNLSN